MSFSGSGSGTGITLRGLVAELSRGLKVDYRSVWKFVHAETLSFKILDLRFRAIIHSTASIIGEVHQSRIEPERLVFIDATWTKTNVAPFSRGAARGARRVAKVPHGHWKTLTFVAALRHDRIAAPFVLDGPINGECFKTYVEKGLVPTLAAGDLVMMDNLGSHKGCKSGFDPPVNVRLRHSSQGPSLAPRDGPKR
jgi:hypothetical protein